MAFGAERSILVKLRADVSDYTAKFTAAGVKARDFAGDVDKSATKQKRNWDEIGTSVGVAGLAIGAAAAVAVKAFADFDKSMSRAAAGTDATVTEMNALREAALQAGADTQFSATQAADAITELGKAGVAIPDILGGGLKGALDLAAAGELNVAQAAEIAATAMVQFRLAGEDLPHVADLLAAGAGKAQGSVQDLGLALSYVGPVAAGMGVSIEETAGSIALLSSNGIIGEKAGTALRGMLLSLTSPSAKAAEEMEKLGISLYDSSGNFIGVSGAAEELKTAMGGLTKEQRDLSLGILFGNEQVTAARVLYEGGGEAVQRWTARVNDAGFAARQAARLTDNLAGDFERFTGSLETAFIGAGSGANEGLRSLTQTATSAVNAFNALPAPIQQSVVTMGGLAAVTLLLGAGTIKAVTGVAALKASLIELTGSAAAARTALAGVATAFGVVAAAAAADMLGDYVGQAQAADVETKRLAASLAKFGETGELAGAGLEQFATGFGPFKDNATDTAEAMDKFGAVAAKALDQGWDARLGRWQSMGTATGRFREQVGDLDTALADMVNRGQADEATAAFERLTQAAVDQGLPLSVISAQFEQYHAAMDGAASSSVEAEAAARTLALGIEDTGTSATAAAEAMQALIEKTATYTSKALGARGSAREYEAALDAATEAAKENGKTLDINTEKGRANEEALDAIAASGIAYAQKTYEATGSTDKFNDILGKTRADLVQAAQRFGMTKEQAEAYADKVLDIPSKAETNVALNGVGAANLALERFRANLGRIPGTKTVYLKLDADGTQGRGLTPIRGGFARADGGLIPRYLGGPRQDNVPLWASGGEWMIRAASVDKAGDTAMAALNAGRLVDAAHMLLARSANGYADGGRVAALVPAAQAFGPQRVISVPVPTPLWGGGPLVGVQQMNLVEGSPNEVANELMFAVRQRGG